MRRWNQLRPSQYPFKNIKKYNKIVFFTPDICINSSRRGRNGAQRAHTATSDHGLSHEDENDMDALGHVVQQVESKSAKCMNMYSNSTYK